jgi:predicted dehydrogenase
MKLGIGLIGAMGRGAYIGQLFNESGDAQVLAVMDHRRESFEVGRERYATAGADPDLYMDLATMLRRNDLDWVVVGTPDRTHFDLARQVILSGKNVFVEKPMTQTTEEADVLCGLIEARGVRLVVGCELRYSPMVETFRKALRDGQIGRPVIGTFVDHVARGYSYYLRDHRKKQWGRGLLMQKGIHAIDMMNDLIDSDPVRVYGTGGLDFFGGRSEADALYCRDCSKAETCPYSFQTVGSPTWKKGGPREKGEHAFDHCVFQPDTDAEDNMHLLVEYENGFRLAYTSVFFASRDSKEVCFWGPKGSLEGRMAGGGASVRFTPHVGAMRQPDAVDLPVGDATGSHGGGDQRFVRAILDAVKEGRPVRPDVWDGRAGVAVAELGLKSMESGQPIDIPRRRRGA